MDVAVTQKLGQARKRLILGQVLRALPLALVLGLIGLLCYQLAAKWRFVLSAGLLTIAIFLLLPLLVAVILAVLRWRSLPGIAQELDRRSGSKDRFATALALEGEQSSPWRVLAGSEIARFAVSLRVSDAVSLDAAPRRFLWVLLPLAGLALLSYVNFAQAAAVAPELARATKLLESARQAAAAQPKPDPAVLKQIDEAMEKVQKSSEPWKEALGALTDLENRLAANQSGAGGLTPKESAALANALGQNNPDLAKLLRDGQQDSAAQKISEMAPDDVKRALEDASRYLEEKRLRDLAQQSAPEAQRSLARIMRNSSSPSQGDGSGQRRLASAIQDAKNDSMGNGSSQGDQGKGNPTDAPNGKDPSAPGRSEDSRPGGSAGSDKDTGTGSDLAGQRTPQGVPSGPDGQLGGMETTGASVVDTYRAAGNDDPQAQRAYRAAYQKAAAAALDSVNQEEIPAGSRLMVKRYFESIRPSE